MVHSRTAWAGIMYFRAIQGCSAGAAAAAGEGEEDKAIIIEARDDITTDTKVRDHSHRAMASDMVPHRLSCLRSSPSLPSLPAPTLLTTTDHARGLLPWKHPPTPSRTIHRLRRITTAATAATDTTEVSPTEDRTATPAFPISMPTLRIPSLCRLSTGRRRSKGPVIMPTCSQGMVLPVPGLLWASTCPRMADTVVLDEGEVSPGAAVDMVASTSERTFRLTLVPSRRLLLKQCAAGTR